MTRVVCHISISVDGFTAGPDQSRDNPLGIGGNLLHNWFDWDLPTPANESDARMKADLALPMGAFIMGRNMYGPIRGEWSEDWRGWWGEDPPYHAPVFVLTHYAHDPIEMRGGTTFHFVTEGFGAAFDRAQAAAGTGDIRIAGGASTVRQALAAGVLDELTLDISPVLLGSGERLFEGVKDPGLMPIEALHSPKATHVRYRVAGR